MNDSDFKQRVEQAMCGYPDPDGHICRTLVGLRRNLNLDDSEVRRLLPIIISVFQPGKLRFSKEDLVSMVEIDPAFLSKMGSANLLHPREILEIAEEGELHLDTNFLNYCHFCESEGVHHE